MQNPAVPPDLYRILVEEAVEHAIVFFDREGFVRHWNPGAERLFGYSADEAHGRYAGFMFLPEHQAEGVPEQEMQTAAATGQASDRRWKQRKDGGQFFADGTMTALRDGAGNVLGFAKIIRDATSEKRAEEACTASEAQLRLIVDGVREYAIYMLDPNGTIRTWSRGAQRIKGYSADEVIGRNFDIFYPPEEIAAGKPRQQLKIAAEAGSYEDESIHVRKDGSRFWAGVVVNAIRDERGTLRGFVNLTHDITDRKRTLERVAFVAEAGRVLASSIEYGETLRRIAHIAVPRIADWCTVDLLTDDNKLRRVAVEHIDSSKIDMARELEKRYPADISRLPFSTMVHERKTLFFPEIGEELLSRMTRDEDHLQLVRSLGLTSAIATPLVVGDRVLGTIMLITAGDRRLTEDDVTVAEDIASRAAIAIQNAELYREAQEANRAKDDFLATVSHELRTPMTAVLGWAKLLRLEKDPAVVAEAAIAIERSASAQAQLIDDILDVARIRVGKLKMRFDDVNLSEVVTAAVETVRLTAEAKNVRIRVEMDRRELPVRGDAQRLQQVVWNLLTNAIKFTPEGGRVDITLENDGTNARITVRDSGPGIPPDFLPHLFERFRQAETTQGRGHGGLGLGLSIARYIVDTHRGTITARNLTEGSGAMFVVDIPLRSEELQTRPASGGSRATDGLESLSGVSVLVVEDDADTANFFARALEHAGADVRVAMSVDAALTELDTRPVDVLLSDIAMPVKTGFDLIRAIRERNGAHLPAIAVTASGTGGDRERALSAGFDDYLRKPVAPHTLIRAVRAILNRPA